MYEIIILIQIIFIFLTFFFTLSL